MTTFTKTETAILALLSDGEPHTRAELRACLSDDMAAESAVRLHVMRIRRKLKPVGEHIVCEWVQRRCEYRHVRLLSWLPEALGVTPSVAEVA